MRRSWVGSNREGAVRFVKVKVRLARSISLSLLIAD